MKWLVYFRNICIGSCLYAIWQPWPRWAAFMFVIAVMAYMTQRDVERLP